MTTTGMCAWCQYDAAAPGQDYCRGCLDDRAAKRRRHLELINEIRCRWFNHPGCTPENPCRECVEFAVYPEPKDAA